MPDLHAVLKTAGVDMAAADSPALAAVDSTLTEDGTLHSAFAGPADDPFTAALDRAIGPKE